MTNLPHQTLTNLPYSASAPAAAPPTHELPAPDVGAGTRFLRRAVIALLLTVVMVPPAAAFYSYFSGVPLHLLAFAEKEEQQEDAALASAPPSTWLVPGKAHTIAVSQDVAQSLGIEKGDHESMAVAQTPTTMRPLELFGSTRLDPTRLARIRARFAPARVVEIAQIHDFSHELGQSEFRELRMGDHVKKGEVLAVFYSVDVQNTKNDLLDALVQLELDQKILDRVREHLDAVPEVFYLQQVRALKGDRTDVNRAMTT
ncbi:MAG TPA: hypothetical protein VG125_26240, partial [Pirellulales bacterium]|nr:hypothetical protein [Pirellulales bacterium]